MNDLVEHCPLCGDTALAGKLVKHCSWPTCRWRKCPQCGGFGDPAVKFLPLARGEP